MGACIIVKHIRQYIGRRINTSKGVVYSGGGTKRTCRKGCTGVEVVYLEPAEYSERNIVSDGPSTLRYVHLLVTDLVPSEMACFASSPGRMRRTEVWISRDEMVDFFLEYCESSERIILVNKSVSRGTMCTSVHNPTEIVLHVRERLDDRKDDNTKSSALAQVRWPTSGVRGARMEA